VLALALRLAFIQLFQAEDMMRSHAWVLVLPSLVFIDLMPIDQGREAARELWRQWGWA
jgi:hypothetical protein